MESLNRFQSMLPMVERDSETREGEKRERERETRDSTLLKMRRSLSLKQSTDDVMNVCVLVVCVLKLVVCHECVC